MGWNHQLVIAFSFVAFWVVSSRCLSFTKKVGSVALSWHWERNWCTMCLGILKPLDDVTSANFFPEIGKVANFYLVTNIPGGKESLLSKYVIYGGYPKYYSWVQYTEIGVFLDYPQFMMLFGISYGQTWGRTTHAGWKFWGQGGQRDKTKTTSFGWVQPRRLPGLFPGCSRNWLISIKLTSRHFVGSLHPHPEAWGIHDPILTSTHFLEGGIGWNHQWPIRSTLIVQKYPQNEAPGSVLHPHRKSIGGAGATKGLPPEGVVLKKKLPQTRTAGWCNLEIWGIWPWLFWYIRSSKRIHHLTLGMQKSLNNHWDNVPTLLEKYLTSIRLLFLCGSSSSPFFSGWDKLRIH